MRARAVRALAAERLREARPRAMQPADLNPVEAVARDGPLATYRYRRADAGPAFAVRFAEPAPEAPGVAWVVGQSGMRLRWDLEATPLRRYLASGPSRLRLALVVHRPPAAGEEQKSPEDQEDRQGREAGEERPKVIVRLADPEREGERMGRAAGRPPALYEVTVEVPATGIVEVPVVPPAPTRAEDALIAPEGGGLVLDVLATGPRLAVGARAHAVTIVGPSDETAPVAAAPTVEAAHNIVSGRSMLVGEPDLPRQMAVFRFDDVPAGRIVGDRTAVEVRYSLDAFSPATIESAAQATFVRPDGERLVLRFTPEGHRPTLLYMERAFWSGGPLEVRLECLSPDDYIGLVPASVRLRLTGEPFLLHYAKGIVHVLLFGAILIAVAVFVANGISWFVGIFAVATIFALGTVGHVLLTYQPIGRSAGWLTRHLSGTAAWTWVVDHLKLQGFLPPDSFVMGETVSWLSLAAAAGAAGLISLVFVAIGAWVIRAREVGA